MEDFSRILALDDDPTSIAIIKSVLGEEGYTVSAFTDVNNALEEFRVNSYDLMLPD